VVSWVTFTTDAGRGPRGVVVVSIGEFCWAQNKWCCSDSSRIERTMSVCLSVCHTRVLSPNRVKHIIELFTTRSNLVILLNSFLTPDAIVKIRRRHGRRDIEYVIFSRP